MKVRISYLVDAPDYYRRAIRLYYGLPGLATREDVKDWHHLHGTSMDDDIVYDLAVSIKGKEPIMGDDHLAFGYNQGLPQDPPPVTAWGCRAIVTQDGSVDVPFDRTSAYGPDEAFNELAPRLDARAGQLWQQRASELLASRAMDTRVAGEHVLADTNEVVIKGNTNGSGGYLYVCAYLKPRR